MVKEKNSAGHFSELYARRESAFREELGRAQKRAGHFLPCVWQHLCLPLVLLYMGSTHLYRVLPFALVLMGSFIVLVFGHERLKRRIDFLNRLVEINQNAGLRLDGQWTAFPGSGQEYIDYNHPYSTDLNIFGKGSLFQYINATGSFRGRQILVEQLSTAAEFTEIEPRQAAVADLARGWISGSICRLRGWILFSGNRIRKEVLAWLEQAQSSRSWMEVVLILPPATIAMFILAVGGLFPIRCLLARWQCRQWWPWLEKKKQSIVFSRRSKRF
jgi:hypothetical protein